jgi:leucyl/phenylalanyl-tRNA--protein transferase
MPGGRVPPAMSLDPRLLLSAYAAGIFPMADSRDADELYWVEPRERAIIPLVGFHLSRSLDRTIRSDRFKVTRDSVFGQVVEHCAARAETWINRDIEVAVNALHAAGHAHSIEVWRAGDLVGGLYGVALGRAFFGESMFSLERNASKVALAWLVARLKAGRFILLDCQIMTPHLASLGAVSVPGSDYAALLSTAIGAVGGSDGAGSVGELELPPPAFGALDDLLSGSAEGAGSPAGKVISQFLTQTS